MKNPPSNTCERMKDLLFFEDRSAFYDFMAGQDRNQQEIWIGFHKVHTGKPSITWQDLVDVCLCTGWIDGKRMTIDVDRWKIRITPRRPGSIWSRVNLKRYAELDRQGLVLTAGRAAFNERREETEDRQAIMKGSRSLDGPYLDQIQQVPAAWNFYQTMSISKRRLSTHWILSAKREDTRQRRLERFINFAAAGQYIPELQV